ncbi:FecR family protein [Dysgonomonas massiliensis]|uniref:FecR family protein n=1 Tax=Dysgonomonas massiliensis TaxID=2040292 RepID=UPI000C76FE53|nr:FecR family protein [Dysgonomonas massiliensis]
MKKSNISAIIKKYLSGRFSPETEERVQRWFINDENTDKKESASLEYWNSLETTSNSETYSALNKVNQRIGYPQKQVVKIPLYKKLSRIAAVLIPLFIIGGGYLYYQTTQNNMIEIQVAYGEEKHLFLPDSSEIWINAGSTIKYPKEFKGNKRVVELDGEAYFSVKRDEMKPFIVNTEKLSVNVLGTKFNVKAYSDEEQITTTLTSGKIEVKSVEQSQILKPNEQLSFNKKTSIINITEISSNETDAWLTGQLVFSDATFGQIIQALERKFNVSFSVDANVNLAQSRYTVKFIKKDSLEDILNVLKEVVGGFSYQINNNEIIVVKVSKSH